MSQMIIYPHFHFVICFVFIQTNTTTTRNLCVMDIIIRRCHHSGTNSPRALDAHRVSFVLVSANGSGNPGDGSPSQLPGNRSPLD